MLTSVAPELSLERRHHVAWIAVTAAMKVADKGAAFALFSCYVGSATRT